MARIRRIKLPGCSVCAYHVVTRVHSKEFRLDDELKEKFIKHLKKLKGLYYVSVAAYSIMDNHYHIILRFANPKD
ncbi:transposase, partial [Candidatus Woesearchaeota archaeon]|nr:transposase [Candidatus Woesearchaeota archaeon]